MSFTYDDALTEDQDKVRFRIGDTVENAGPRPDKRNYSDSEIAFFLSEEDGRLNGAIAAAFETLAGEWRAWALSEREGEAQIDARGVASGYLEQAAIWRKKPGGASEAERDWGLVPMIRTDGYYDARSEYA